MAKRAPAETAAGAGAANDPPAAATTEARSEKAPPKQAKTVTVDQAPSPRRIVDYCDREDYVEAVRRGIPPEPIPAIIRRVRNDDGVVDLCVFSDIGARNIDAVPLAELPTPGHWSWPPAPVR